MTNAKATFKQTLQFFSNIRILITWDGHKSKFSTYSSIKLHYSKAHRTARHQYRNYMEQETKEVGEDQRSAS